MRTYILKYTYKEDPSIGGSYFETTEDCREERCLNSNGRHGKWVDFWSEEDDYDIEDYDVDVVTPYEMEQDRFIDSI